MNNQLTNGGIWNDSSGNPIHAHGGHMLFHDDYYYWYGEDRRDDIYVSCYRSKDLFNWEFRNHILTTSTPAAPIRVRTNLALANDKGGKVNLERPKVLFNAVTKKFVLWAHYENGNHYNDAACAIATSDSPDSHFVYHGGFNPYGYMSRDCTLFQDDDGTAYFISSTPETMRTCTSIVCRRIISMWKVLSERCGRGSIGRRQPSSNGKGSIIW